MNKIAEEMRAVLDGEEIQHYGMPRRSGRYPWGSGDEPYQHSRDWLARYDEMKKSGMKEREIAKELGYFDSRTGEPSPSKLRAARSNEINIRDIYQFERAKSLKEDGLGWTEMSRKMGVSESTIRGWFDEEKQARNNAALNLAEFIKKRVDEDGIVDVGRGVELEMGVSREKMKQAMLMLEEEGYPNYGGGTPQRLNPGQQTNSLYICKPGTPHKDVFDPDKVFPLNKENYVSHDNGETFVKKFTYPESMDSKRLQVLYADDKHPDGGTGVDRDGIIELRRGVADLSLGNDRYSQVRILVDGTHYLKGMAVYSDSLPDGIDVRFNSNKPKGMPWLGEDKNNSVLKKISDDKENPFGSLIKDSSQGGQYWYDGKDGTKKLGLINKRAAEGDWDEWANALPSQFLGKQSKSMAKKQLDLAKADKLAEFEDICSIPNPTLKRHLLKDFADQCEAAAVDLKAAALPGQKYHVIVPINSLKDNEVYAPGYENGTKLALIRYPHAGTFEIPVLTVNNRHAAAKKIIGTDSVDAVGITKRNADRLSGADFDGDTVMAIPTDDPGGKVKIARRDQLKGLVDFDPHMEYPYKEGMTIMSKKNTQKQMGIISNLITDMTIAGASDSELAAAVRHSMVVIDANKHRLNYKESEIRNNIAALQKRYQPKYDEDGNEKAKGGGAATILSRAKGDYSVLKRQGSPYANIPGKKGYDPTKPDGALIYKTADADKLYRPVKKVNAKTGVVTLYTTDGQRVKYNPKNDDERAEYQPIKYVDKASGTVTYKSKSGKYTYQVEPTYQKSTRMAETDDAHTLVSPKKHQIEILYADYANSMKDLARRARLEEAATGTLKYSKAAKTTYLEEYNSLMNKLHTAQMNAPREREVQRRVNAEYLKAKRENPDIEKDDLKKRATRIQSNARIDVGAVSRKDRNIKITDREWEAIQAGAITDNILSSILANTDSDSLKARAMPRQTSTLTATQVNRMKALANSGYTLDEIAKKMGKSPSTVSKYLKGKV